MGFQLVDYAWARPNLTQVKAAGYAAVCRYLSWRLPDNYPHGKVVSPEEVAAIHAAGLGLILNWEWTARDPFLQSDAGTIHAHEALAQARELGYPKGLPIIFSAADFDATPEQQAPINAYLQQVRAVFASEYLVGLYGGFYPIGRAFDAGVIDVGWQTFAWSGGQWEPRAALRQVHNGVNVGGGDCDIDEAVGDVKLWWPTTTPPPSNPAPPAPTPPGASGPNVYVVRSGDTLSAIASRFRTTWQILQQINGIPNANLIYPGQRILLPGGSVVQDQVWYTVVSGDTLSAIATKYGTTWQNLASLNHLANPNLIFPNQRIRIR